MSNLQENDADVQVTKNSPGKCLRKAREDRGLSRKDIAERLHLSEQVIDAIEKDDQDHLPASTFVRGYLRGYAPLVSLDADSVIADYNNYFADTEDKNETRGAVHVSMGSKRTGRAKIGKMGMYLALVVFVVAGVGYFSGQESTDDISSVQVPAINSGNNIENTGTELADSNSLQIQVSGFPYQISENNPENQQKQPLSGNLDSGNNQEKYAEKTNDSPKLSSWDHSDLLDGSGEVFPSPESDPVGARSVGVDSLKMQFHADAWVEVFDSNGDRLLYRLGREGKTYQVTGIAPFKVLLGNAREVTVIVNGQVFDHAPFIRGQVAQFSVGKESAGKKSAGEELVGESSTDE